MKDTLHEHRQYLSMHQLHDDTYLWRITNTLLCKDRPLKKKTNPPMQHI